MSNTSLTTGLKEGTTNADVLMATYNAMDSSFKERIEPLFSEADLAKFGEALSEYTPGANEFLYELINQIGRINVNYRRFTSPLKFVKRGMLEYGDTIEDMYIDPVSAMNYEPEVPNGNPGDLWQTFKPVTDVVFYKENKQFVYPLTLNKDILKRAFRSYADLDKYIGGAMQAMYNGDEIDDYKLTVKLLSNAYTNGLCYKVHVDEINSEASAKSFATEVNSLIELLKFPSRKYNAKGVMSWSLPEDMLLITTPKTSKFIDINVLAYAFNMDKADLMGRKVVVDELPEGVTAMLVDKEAFQVWDTLIDIQSTGLNARHLTTNYYLHHHGIFAIAPYWACVAFTTDSVSEATAVTISGKDSVTKGESAIYTASVTGGATSGVLWTIENNPQYVAIDQNGKLTVGAKCTESTITIKATSIDTPSVSVTKAIGIA